MLRSGLLQNFIFLLLLSPHHLEHNFSSFYYIVEIECNPNPHWLSSSINIPSQTYSSAFNHHFCYNPVQQTPVAKFSSAEQLRAGQMMTLQSKIYHWTYWWGPVGDTVIISTVNHPPHIWNINRDDGDCKSMTKYCHCISRSWPTTNSVIKPNRRWWDAWWPHIARDRSMQPKSKSISLKSNLWVFQQQWMITVDSVLHKRFRHTTWILVI